MEKRDFDVLIVDDEKDVLHLAGDYLRANGFTVLTAMDADRAMRQLDENKVAILILDVNLAGENGLSLMKFIKPNHPDIPIIIYTGLTHDDKQVKAMLANGANCYVDKSQPKEALLFAVRELHPRKSD
jgi:twitching motility two-component system response regulator PilH